MKVIRGKFILLNRGDSMKNDIRNWQETETESKRVVSYDTERAHIRVHIPKRTPEQQEAYEKNVKAALRRFYNAVTSKGYDWDKLVAESNLCS